MTTPIYLLDTCTLSELTRKVPNADVMRWLDSTDLALQCTSAACLSELQRGVYRLRIKQSTELARVVHRYDSLKRRLRASVFGVDERTWDIWAQLMGEADATGRVRPALDTLIAATALQHGLTVVTRNVRDFEDLAPCLNPWEP